MTILTRIGIIEIAFSAVILPVLLFEPAQRLFPRLLKDRKQLLQAHLDYFFMGILLILAGTVLQPIPIWITIPMIIGSLGNPSVFLINSINPELPQNMMYRLFILISCGLTAFAWGAMGVRAVM
ncbi:hypothetical protein CEE37_12640 [candidate division LCP-89 bacterium B3_LCP]|uniref:Uncharacterized protein n=1 Tax=candidate division LCP-89 bacterium B3_LCP TaxID=2012998 RepID=A0A532UTX3_UNCL8|nr:MAG: hypothetical protein CEE37_12640 [candidate division LCP-89 bacterium B3_LCP]